MSQLPIPRPEIYKRLHKIEGQIRGIEKMVDSERDCVDILMQLTAVKSGLQSVAALVLQNYTSICLKQKGNRDNGADLALAVAIWIGGRG
ncbi:metal-sensitive transcriptional regulator [Chloroflexota bacterium]